MLTVAETASGSVLGGGATCGCRAAEQGYSATAVLLLLLLPLVLPACGWGQAPSECEAARVQERRAAAALAAAERQEQEVFRGRGAGALDKAVVAAKRREQAKVQSDAATADVRLLCDQDQGNDGRAR